MVLLYPYCLIVHEAFLFKPLPINHIRDAARDLTALRRAKTSWTYGSLEP